MQESQKGQADQMMEIGEIVGWVLVVVVYLSRPRRNVCNEAATSLGRVKIGSAFEKEGQDGWEIGRAHV